MRQVIVCNHQGSWRSFLLRQTIGKIPPLYRMVNRIRGFRLDEPQVKIAYDFIGTWYGGWTLPKGYLHENSVVYSAGVGEDISFELGLIEKIGCVIHGFDPTPIAMKWVEKQQLPEKYEFHNIGLAEEDGDMEFFAPVDAHSFSRIPGDAGSAGIKCPVLSLPTIMSNLGHKHIDLLKIDIEGFEYAVIDNFISARIVPRVFNVEFHHGVYGIQAEQTKAYVRKLQDIGYKIYWVSDFGREYGFIFSPES